jgi:hypothetical protein
MKRIYTAEEIFLDLSKTLIGLNKIELGAKFKRIK